MAEKLPYRAWMLSVDEDLQYLTFISRSYLRYLKRILDTWLALQSDGSRRAAFTIVPDDADLVDDIRILRLDGWSDLPEVDGLYRMMDRLSADPDGVDILLSARDLNALVDWDWSEWSGIADLRFRLSQYGTARIMFGDYNYCDPYDQRPYFVSLLINLSGVDHDIGSGEVNR